jgi:hypothetical protein
LSQVTTEILIANISPFYSKFIITLLKRCEINLFLSINCVQQAFIAPVQRVLNINDFYLICFYFAEAFDFFKNVH